VSEKLHDLRLVGSSESAGGRFAKLQITGDSKLAGRVACKSFALTGTAEIHGDMEAEAMKVTGELHVRGRLQAGACSGMGEVVADGGVRGEKLTLSGRLKSDGLVEAETLDVRGVVEAEQGVNAGHATLRMYGPSRVKELVGGTITVRKSRGMKLKGMLQSDTRTGLEASLIEGDEVYAEWTRAEIVRGTKVKLGPGCEIERVEYRDSLQVHKKSSVGVSVRL
jgi:cytoskeletal protein CcmA (bactofilin family)